MVEPLTVAGVGAAGYFFEKVGGKELTVKFFGPATDYLGEQLKGLVMYGAENLKSVIQKATTIQVERGVEKTVPLKIRHTLPFIQGAMLEDDPNLQDMWAGLLANSTDPERRLDANKLYIKVLSDLEPLDVLILKHLLSKGWLQLPTIPGGGITLKQIVGDLSVNEEEVKLSILNLCRLECIVAQKQATWDTMDGVKTGLILENDMFFRLSSLGAALLSACQVGGEQRR